jgi:hypothetical protein
MELWSGQVNRVQMVQTAPLAKATRELVLEATQRLALPAKATQRVERRQVSENQRARANLGLR